MKKRLLSVLLALCLALSLLPGPALAAGSLPPSESAYWNNKNMQVAIGFIKSILTNPPSSNIVLVYYQANGCANSATYVPQYAAFAESSRLRMYGYAYDPAAEMGEEGYSLPAADLQALLGKSSYTFPVVIAYNGQTKEHRAKDAVVGLDALKALLSDCGLYTDPGPGPGGPTIDLIDDATVYPQSWEVLRLVNQHRMGMGLEPLSLFDGLQKVANQRAYEIYIDYRADHTRPDGSICWTAYDDYGVSYQVSAENIASGQRDAADVMNSWLNSPGHRANIEKTNVTHIGVGVYTGSSGRNYWTQDFAAARYCVHTNLRLSKTSIPSQPGTDLDALLKAADVTLTYNCQQYGECRMPLISAMCSGYDKDAAGNQTLTVSCGGMTAELFIAGEGGCLEHDFGQGTVTKEPTCTETGTRTFTCSKCGETKTEAIPAKGHSYETDSAGNQVCTVCGHTIPASVSVEDQLDQALEAADPETAKAILDGLDREALKNELTSAVYDKLEALEAKIGGAAAVDVSGSGLSGAKIVGAKLSTGYDSPATLKISQPEDAALPTPDPSAKNVFRFSMNLLDGAGEEIELTVPVRITIPLPMDNLDTRTFRLWHFHDGKMDEIKPELHQESGRWYATFTVGGFSDFLMTYSTVSIPEIPTLPGDGGSTTPGGGTGTTPQPTLYEVSVQAADHGTATLSRSTAAKGDRVTVTVKPDAGWQLESLTVRDKDGRELELTDRGSGQYSFTMPASAVSVEAVFSQIPTAEPDPTPEPEPLPFTDVPDGAWFASEVRYVYEKGLMAGDGSEVLFNPTGVMTRAMLWTVLARLDGADTSGGSIWYEPGRAWAMAKGISDGENPQESVTREQLAAMLWRYAGSPAGGAGLESFSDAGTVSGWAEGAVRWAVSAGILNGSGGRLNPTGTATRAEVAVMLTRFAQSLEK